MRGFVIQFPRETRACTRPFTSALALFSTVVLCFLSSLSAATGQVLADDNSQVDIVPASQAGMSHWVVQGIDQMQQQWFWYGLGNGPVASIDTISTPTVNLNAANNATIGYGLPGSFSISVNYLLHGGTNVPIGPQYNDGIARSEVLQTVTISNTSSSMLPFHLYQYAHLDVLGLNGHQTAQFRGTTLTPAGPFIEVDQSAFPYDFGDSFEALVTTNLDLAEVAPLGQTLAKLNSGGPVNLGPPYFSGPLGPGEVTWALQWDFNIPAGGSAIVATDELLQNLRNVPEPAAAGLIAAGFMTLFRSRRYRR
jgi:hypothetical protein